VFKECFVKEAGNGNLRLFEITPLCLKLYWAERLVSHEVQTWS